MLDNIFGIHLPHGDLFLYGENLNRYMPYLTDFPGNMEDICLYCQQRNIFIYYKVNHNLKGLVEFLRIYRLTKKYNVRGSWKELSRYFETAVTKM